MDDLTFRDGFKEGYRMIKGSYVAVPGYPARPATPAGSTEFREGLKAGIKVAGGKIVLSNGLTLK